MTTNLLYSFLINSIEVKDYVLHGTKIVRMRNSVIGDSAEIQLDLSVDDVLTLTEGQSIVISRGVSSATEDYKFRGNIKRIEIQGDRYIVTCKNNLNKFKYDTFTYSYDINTDSQAGELSAIAEDIITDGGLTPDVESSGTDTGDIVIEKFISRRQTRMNRLNLIARILNWFIYEDYNSETIKLQPKGYNTYTNPLVVGTNVYNIPRWTVDIEKMRNKITVEGAFDIDTRTENEVGDGSTATFNFTNTPESTNLTVDGTLLKLGVEGSIEVYNYTVDKEAKTYTFETADIPAIGETILMTYTTLIPRPVTGKNQTSIDKYGLTQEEVFKFDDVVTINDAETRVSQLLTILKDGEVSTTLHTDEYTIETGDLVEVQDSRNPSKNGTYVVESITINYPEITDVVKIGSERVDMVDLFNTIEERLKILEEKNTGSEELLRHILSFDKDIDITRDSYSVTKYKICDSFIAGHNINGLIGLGTTLDNFDTGSAANWAMVGTLSDSTDQAILGTHSMKAVNASGAVTSSITCHVSQGDLSQYTGSSFGAPTKGTVGLWVYVSDVDDVTNIILWIGSSSTTWTSSPGKAYASVDGYDNWDDKTFSLQVGWNYILFHLTDADAYEYDTPDWTDVDYINIRVVFSGNATIYLDYLTISESNYIGLNGVGTRKMEME